MKFEPNKRGMDQLSGQISTTIQAAVDDVYRSHANQPAADVKRALRSKLKRIGVELPAETLDVMATHISEGRRVQTGG